jgi:hypothetical protein
MNTATPTSGTPPAPAPAPADGRDRSRTLATWLALLAGLFGAHRFYLHGRRDLLAWIHPVLSLAGLAGVIRMRNLGQDDHAAWLLIPLFGIMVAVVMLSTIVIGLTPAERWSARFGARGAATGWPVVIALVVALLVGGAALMGTLAFAGQMFFEYQKL